MSVYVTVRLLDWAHNLLEIKIQRDLIVNNNARFTQNKVHVTYKRDQSN